MTSRVQLQASSLWHQPGLFDAFSSRHTQQFNHKLGFSVVSPRARPHPAEQSITRHRMPTRAGPDGPSALSFLPLLLASSLYPEHGAHLSLPPLCTARLRVCPGYLKFGSYKSCCAVVRAKVAAVYPGCARSLRCPVACLLLLLLLPLAFAILSCVAMFAQQRQEVQEREREEDRVVEKLEVPCWEDKNPSVPFHIPCFDGFK